MILGLDKYWRCASAALLLVGGALPGTVRSELYINEIFLDPGGMGFDGRDEYIELRGTPGMSLDSYYLIFIENEDKFGHTGTTGHIENIFMLGDNPNTMAFEEPYRIGENGFMTIRQRDSKYTNISDGTFDIINTGSGQGYGSGSTSSIRHWDQGNDGITENSGFTVMLIRNNGDPVDNQPFLGLDMDGGNDGLDDASNDQADWNDYWEIVDSIGIFSEPGEAGLGRLYARVNFGPEIPGQILAPEDGGVWDPELEDYVFVPNVEDGAVYVGLGYEIEYVGRWGNSTGQTPDDWHASNLSDRTVAGHFTASSGVPDYRQSGLLHDSTPSDVVESSQYVPYGTPLTTTLGAPNYPLNLEFLPWDYNHNGVVDAADYTVWRDALGQTGMGLVADGDGSGTVGRQDYLWWKARFGYSWIDVPGYVPPTSAGGLADSVPEPASALLGILGTAAPLMFALRRRGFGGRLA